ncbi:prepilin-type N-terminal cleavage/methylation domain-containing protein [Massilia sp. S19_KUP03_FR1]|uniref:prepilin-type N-terminal cleavage/methylation domain-containing protein n=1 Tax=Massilia sp. S19_KUP03_FR1 TaxID=3025503 RepID=UPI002FCDE137
MAGLEFRASNIVAGHFHVRQRGFTLVELVVVLIIVGILGAIGAVRYFDRRGFDSAAFAEQTRAALRFGQKLAIAQHRAVYAQMNGSTIALCFASTAPCPAASRVPAPGSNGGATVCAPSSWYCVAPPATMSYAVSPSATSTLCFNALGQPGLPVSGSTTACNAGAFLNLTVNISGDGNTTQVNVVTETGYVY